ncbi:hypothetical protein EJ357_06950 [Streptomyces cyaneochromogenes]|uniref:Uncharacterized protein n=1 Tax=Streptomyces cyaneochromogenes TaxID=2496836 RepID=A0A3Q9EPT4_9ACTN|nr:hypothetical protein [Streptomyces cyaneochromogenes]AZQ33219.1 hypothetical protein EJ357_06950 [Streptomyces cyaneochromogenes]
MELELLLAQTVPAITAAVALDGADVLRRTEDVAASGTAHLGQRLLARLTGSRPQGTDGVARAVTDLAESRGGEDEQAALRVELRKLLRDDEGLRRELALLLPQNAAYTASGDRAVAVQHNEGIISTGDGAHNVIRRQG